MGEKGWKVHELIFNPGEKMKRFAYLFAALAILANPLAAQEKINTPKKEKVQESYKLDSVEVEDNKKEFGKQTIGGKMLQMTPSKSDSITEALRGMSNVQFSYDADNSQTLGEITPPRVSISGAKPYENNYMIDGLSITNTINPTGITYSPPGATTLADGADQNIFINTDLIEKIDVYSSNAPAKYGNFVGGVIDAELKDPRTDRWHFSMESKYTQDAFFELRDVKKDSEDQKNQPRFKKWKTSFSADGPISNKISSMVSFSKNYSEIPLLHKTLNELSSNISSETNDQIRKNENFFTRFVIKPHDDLSIFFDGVYAPYEAKVWKKNYTNADLTFKNNSYRLSTGLDLKLKPGKLSTKLSFLKSNFSNDSQSNKIIITTLYPASGPTKKQKMHGRLGDNETDNKELEFTTDFSFNQIQTKNFTLNIDAGVQISDKNTDVWTQEASMSNIRLYQRNKTKYGKEYNNYLRKTGLEEYSDSKGLTNIGSYIQTKFNLNKLDLNPGFRFDYDSFSNNFDLSPRFSAGYDVFGNGSLKLIAGANRYYGSQLRSYAFKQKRRFVQTDYYYLNDDLQYKSSAKFIANNKYDMNELNTPYSDELMGGVTGSIWGFNYSFEYVHRNHEDQLVSEKINHPENSDFDDEYRMTNNGSSEYNGYTFTLSKNLYTEKVGNHFFSLGATKSKTKTSHATFHNFLIIDAESKGYNFNPYKVYYDGEFIDRSKLPAKDYNAPLVLTFTMNNSFFNDRLRLQSVTTWRDSCKKLYKDDRLNNETPNGTTSGSNKYKSGNWINDDGVTYSEAYKYGKISSGFITNMTMEFDAVKMEKATLSLILQVNNIFSNKLESDTDSDSTSHGRGYYLGCRATF